MSRQNPPTDPFGRVGRRHAVRYSALKTRLLAEGITSIEALDATTRRIDRTSWLFAAIVIGVTVMIAATVPPWRGLVTVFGVLAMAWIIATALLARLHLRRYRAELQHLARDQTTDSAKKTSIGEHQ